MSERMRAQPIGSRGARAAQRNASKARLALLASLLLVVSTASVCATPSRAPAVGPEVHAVRLSSPTVAVYDKLELRVDLSAAWTNPFDPDDVRVDGLFRQPDGTVLEVPGFLYQDFISESGAIRARGEPTWQLRFSPLVPGAHAVEVRVRDRHGVAISDAVQFTATAARSAGFVRSDPGAAYLRFDDGQSFFPIGTNYFVRTELDRPLPADRLPRMEALMDAFTDHGGNFFRLRMDSWFLSIEGPPRTAVGFDGAGRYSLRSAWEIDRLFDRAEQRGALLQLTLYNANAHVNEPTHERRRAYNLFGAENDGPLRSMQAFWTDVEVARLVRQKIRYAVARWGYSRALLAFEFFNEVDLPPDRVDPIAAWHRDMASYLRALDPWRHMVTSSVLESAFERSMPLWTGDALDIVQEHVYTINDMSAEIPPRVLARRAEVTKPFLIAEFGLSQTVRFNRRGQADPAGVHVHNALWASALSGASGTAMPWFLEAYIDRFDLYRLFDGIASFMQQVALRDGPLASVEVDAVLPASDAQPTAPRDVVLSGRVDFRRSRVSRFTVGADGRINDASQLSGYLWGRNHERFRNPPTFVVDYPSAGRFLVRVGSVVGREDSRLRIFLDNQLALERELPAGAGRGKRSVEIPRFKQWRTLYDEELAIDVPAGQHEIRVEFEGRDRVDVTYTLAGYGSSPIPLRVVGLAARDRAYLWVHNVHHTWQAVARGGVIAPVAASIVRVSGLADGHYDIEYWDTRAGRVASSARARAVHGRLAIAVPGFERDLAVIARRR